ncbi:hypothetical protein BOTBODRAFT_375877 [Botryobasidium botryosum FD-172 SS1]|uniref:Uncharacterized protein n=1 Tax=Botryobasidium botryosum (strain FD-172 SS1) TaxID=930990 RepID=A0A067N6J6_BOTB1|nr:hypothetical protein BOTBODRAFT_375877 [Botryobasidium botryosum FD-172 SS1]
MFPSCHQREPSVNPRRGRPGKARRKERDKVVSAEQLASEHYKDQGFQGYRSEGRVVSTKYIHAPLLIRSTRPSPRSIRDTLPDRAS